MLQKEENCNMTLKNKNKNKIWNILNEKYKQI